MAPATSNTAASRHVSADPKEGLWTLEYLTLLHLLYTRSAFADPKKRSQHVIAIFQRIFKFDLLITHPSPSRTLKDRHIPDKYLFRNKAGRGGKLKEVEADPKSPEQQARVDKIMPLIRSAITDLGFQNAISEAQAVVAGDDDDGEEGEEAGEEAGEEEDDGEVEASDGEDEGADAIDEYVEGQSRSDTRLQRGTKRKQSPDLPQNGSASKKNRSARSRAASVVKEEASEPAEQAAGGDTDNGKTSTSDDGNGRTAIRSSSRRTVQSSRLQEAIADGDSDVIGTTTNATAAATSSYVDSSPAGRTKQKDVKKASSARSSWNGPGTEQRRSKKKGLSNSGSMQYPIYVGEEVEDVLQMISADGTPKLLKMMQKAKLSGDLAKSSNVVDLSKYLYKIENPLASQADIAADWQETERRMFNQWAVQQSSSRLAGGDDESRTQEPENYRGKTQLNAMPSIDLTSMPDSPSTTSDVIADPLRRQPHAGAQLSKSFRNRHDSAISLTNTPYTSSLPTPPTYGPRVEKPTNAFLLRPFYGPKPPTASSVGRTGVGVQFGSEATSAEGVDLATNSNSSGKEDDSAQASK
ncbi:hypothetical protein LTR56_010041 [Elasticomyces elasticus]|nr:hypothetical protein LTR56_010041 [Elasticomyces elasticus]KAK3665014.1 hypothetical protein LTR22_004067 [Elasticomyces elasticus]KAK4931610.1 hypothetical protein LTR49_002001 [Elasticomyces elasticus]KAK5766769.1 hypothetical protein LTS12_003121 [Elasticomyces elasticus]